MKPVYDIMTKAIITIGAIVVIGFVGFGISKNTSDTSQPTSRMLATEFAASAAGALSNLATGHIPVDSFDPPQPSACVGIANPVTVTVDTTHTFPGTYIAGTTGDVFGYFTVQANCAVTITGFTATPNYTTGYSQTNPPASQYYYYNGSTLLGSSNSSISSPIGYMHLTQGQTVDIIIKLDLTAQSTAKLLRILLTVTSNAASASSLDAPWAKIRPGGTVTCSAGTVPTYQYLRQFGSAGTSDGQFDWPFGMTINPSGTVLYESDYRNNRIQEFTLAGQYIAQWGVSGSGNGQFNWPEGIAFGPNGNIYVVDQYNYRIQEFTPAGQYIAQWGGYGEGNGEFEEPFGIAIDSSGNVYVTDAFNDNVQKFTSNGTYIIQWGTNGSGNGQLNGPIGITIDSAGDVYVADTSNSRIQEYTATGQYLSQFGGFGTENGQFIRPWGILVTQMAIYVPDEWGTNLARIQEFTPTGQYVSQFGSYGSGNGQFYEPSVLTI